MIEVNGASHEEQRQLPVLGIAWDEKSQTAQFLFDNQEFKTWNFILGVLEMARQNAEHNLKMQQMANVKNALAQQQQDQIIAQQIRNKGLRG